MTAGPHPLAAAEQYAREQTDNRVFPALIAEIDSLRAQVSRLGAQLDRHVTHERLREQQRTEEIRDAFTRARRDIADDLRHLNDARALVNPQRKTVRMDDLRRALGYDQDTHPAAATA